MSDPDPTHPNFAIVEAQILRLINRLEEEARQADVDNRAFGAIERRRAAEGWRKFLEKQRRKYQEETTCVS